MNDFRPRWSKSIQPLVETIKRLSVDEQRTVLQTALDSFNRSNSVLTEEAGDKSTIHSKLSTRITSLEDLLKKSNVDLDVWEVERHVINKWEVGSTIEGIVVVEELFQVKAWLKKRTDLINLVDIKNDMLELMSNHSPKVSRKEYKNDSKNLLEISIFDLHFGKYVREMITGANYDTNEARERFLNSLKVLIGRSSYFTPERILFPIGNDFFNSDSFRNQTTKGTPQDEHLLWQETVKYGKELLIDAIEYLSQFAPVDVVVVQGNHDWERMFMVGEMMAAYFYHNENVSVDNGATARKYYKYGKCLIGFTHGNNEKVMDLPLIMAQEQPILWKDTKFREFHLGHLHHRKDIKWKSTQEYKGITVRHLRSLSESDIWHNVKGYVGAQKTATAFVWSKNEGLIAELSHSI